MEVFEGFGQRTVGKVIGQQGQERVAEQGQVGQEVGVAGTGAIFPQQHVAPPMVANFHPAPVPPDQPLPLGWAILVGRGAGQVVAGFGGGQSGLFDGALTAQDDQGPGEGEVGVERFEGEGVQVADLDPSVAGFGVDKKGVSGKASKPRACWSRLGWLPLIWNR